MPDVKIDNYEKPTRFVPNGCKFYDSKNYIHIELSDLLIIADELFPGRFQLLPYGQVLAFSENSKDYTGENLELSEFLPLLNKLIAENE